MSRAAVCPVLLLLAALLALTTAQGFYSQRYGKRGGDHHEVTGESSWVPRAYVRLPGVITGHQGHFRSAGATGGQPGSLQVTRGHYGSPGPIAVTRSHDTLTGVTAGYYRTPGVTTGHQGYHGVMEGNVGHLGLPYARKGVHHSTRSYEYMGR